MPKNLDHLSDTEIETLMQRYYDGEAVTKLLKEYHLSVRAAELYKLFPPEICKDEICEYCGENLVRERLSKAASAWRRNDSDMYCPICNHRPYAHRCRCVNCIEEERILAAYQREQINAVYSRKRTPVDFSEISFEQKVFLGRPQKILCNRQSMTV